MMIYPDQNRQEKRRQWKNRRLAFEQNHRKRNRYGKRKRSLWDLFVYFLGFFKMLLKMTLVYRIGEQNARNVVLQKIEIHFKDLPEAFDGYQILHLSDLHLDFIPELEAMIRRCLAGVVCDLCVLTGDYRHRSGGAFKQVVKPLRGIIETVRAKDGTLAILGNHDTCRMADDLERMGIFFLSNESVEIRKGDQSICITGLDDPHYYFTPQALEALKRGFGGFKIALVHTPELYDVAALNSYQLYLCGHTHGGQICLPGGIPLVTHLDAGKRFYRGLWKYAGMYGYTSRGCGSVGIPVRFFSQAEATLITLRRQTSP